MKRMKNHIHAMSRHLLELLVCVLVIFNSQVNGSKQEVNITLVKGAVKKGAVCLDGSPPAYYHAKGYGSGSKNWIVFLEGGGWCGSIYGCTGRSKGPLGSSLYKANVLDFNYKGILNGLQTTNPDFYNWNKVYVTYCDGSFYSGDVKKVDPEYKLYRRGARIFKAIMKELLGKGMKRARNAILTGISAGGLATIIHCDGFRALFSNDVRVKCIADSGFFIRGKNLPEAEKKREAPFAIIVKYHKIGKLLPKSCTSKMAPGLCLFPENLVRYVQTPLFLVNSAFDTFQIRNLEPVQPGWRNCTRTNLKFCTLAQIEAIKDFGKTLRKALPKRHSQSSGMFIDSCYFHDQILFENRWQGPQLMNKTIAKAVSDWYFDRSTFHVIDYKHDFPMSCTTKQQGHIISFRSSDKPFSLY